MLKRLTSTLLKRSPGQKGHDDKSTSESLALLIIFVLSLYERVCSKGSQVTLLMVPPACPVGPAMSVQWLGLYTSRVVREKVVSENLKRKTVNVSCRIDRDQNGARVFHNTVHISKVRVNIVHE